MQFKQSNPVTIIPYQPHWPAEFQHIGTDLRRVLGKTAVPIDHIGSTSVPQLPAKDIIDIQITVADLEDRYLDNHLPTSVHPR